MFVPPPAETIPAMIQTACKSFLKKERKAKLLSAFVGSLKPHARRGVRGSL